jgi:hypothetical protein
MMVMVMMIWQDGAEISVIVPAEYTEDASA